jgi:hypothetical protein
MNEGVTHGGCVGGRLRAVAGVVRVRGDPQLNRQKATVWLS